MKTTQILIIIVIILLLFLLLGGTVKRAAIARTVIQPQFIPVQQPVYPRIPIQHHCPPWGCGKIPPISPHPIVIPGPIGGGGGGGGRGRGGGGRGGGGGGRGGGVIIATPGDGNLVPAGRGGGDAGDEAVVVPIHPQSRKKKIPRA